MDWSPQIHPPVKPENTDIDAGAVRHLCGWKARTHQEMDIAKVPAELR
ncbi:hypothetical protein [Verrucosispora sp. SN26_14.1]|nr:hypothetical protein [Verrucosispora sp. SN26_14.1]